MFYRADIDGLRAVAVVAVVLFHAGFAAFSGGFVGVDVFFVISGYLITGIIAAEIKAARFSLANFYERRIRRIFPALFVMIACSAVAAFFLFMPVELKDYSQSLVAASLSSSNFLFWLEAGYFDAPAEMKPLLHTWSLAVEEQFYLFLPLLLLFGARFLKRRWLALCLPIVLASFLGSVWLLHTQPSAAFYLLPARAWELLLGSLLALGLFAPLAKPALREAAAAAGLAMIAWAVVGFGPGTAFPGANALWPCLGAGLIIHAGAGGPTAAGRLLSTPVMVFLGLISYSLYLWHWPVIVFAKYYAIRELGSVEIGLVLLLSLLLATASWHYVEKPFRPRRRRASPAPRRAFAAAGALTVAAIAIGLAGHLGGGFPQRLPAAVVAYANGATDINPDRERCHLRGLERALSGRLCTLGPTGEPRFIVWGDSMADAMQPAFQLQASKADAAGSYASHSGCPPLLGVTRADYPDGYGCREFNDAIIGLIGERNIKKVVLVGHWSGYDPAKATGGLREWDALLTDELVSAEEQGSFEKLFYRALRRTLARLADQGAEVWLVKQPPESGSNEPSVIARTVFLGKPPESIFISAEAHAARERKVNRAIERLRAEFDFRVIDPAALLCASGRCVSVSEGHPLYRDVDHLSSFGALYLQGLLSPIFESGPGAGVRAEDRRATATAGATAKDPRL